MCVADEAFLLGPPKWLKASWLKPHDRQSTLLFQRFKASAPPGLLPNGPTVQGVYCMTAEGEYLSGFFAWAFPARAQRTIEVGWQRYRQLARRNGWKPQPVPATPIEFTGGADLPAGGVKLQVTVRDLPRGSTQRPGHNEQQRCAHNLNWFDLSPTEAAGFVTTRSEPHSVPTSAFHRLALKTLKDCVRGQCGDWPKGSLRDGRLETQLIARSGDVLTMRLSGYAILQTATRSYACGMHGRVVYDSAGKSFRSFELVAAGQRSGRTQFNSRQGDLGPAPMGVAYVMHRRVESPGARVQSQRIRGQR